MNQNQTLILCAVFLALPNFFPVQADQTAASCITDKGFDLQGHRGARGLFPENTVPGFLYALDLGVTTLEMDVVINAQGSGLG